MFEIGERVSVAIYLNSFFSNVRRLPNGVLHEVSVKVIKFAQVLVFTYPLKKVIESDKNWSYVVDLLDLSQFTKQPIE